MKVTKRRFISNCVALLLMVTCIVSNLNGTNNAFVAIITCLIGLAALVRVRKSATLMIIYGIILYCNYSICAANFFFHIESFFTSYSGEMVSAYGINILLFFSTLLFCFTPRSFSNKSYNLLTNNQNNPIIFWGAIVILMLIWVFGFTRPEVAGERGSPSTMYEYSIIFIILAFYYSGKNRVNHIILIGVITAFALQNFIFGGRITGLQLLVCLYIVMFIDIIPHIVVLITSVLLFILMNAIGTMRGGFTLKAISLSSFDALVKRNGLALDTAYSSFFTSLTFLLQESSMSIGDRLSMFMKWILSIVLGGSVKGSNLAEYTRQTYMHYMGGILPFFGQFYLGPLGVGLLGYYLKKLFKIIAEVSDESSGLMRCLSIYVVTTCFRWYLYSPSQLFRGVLLLCVSYWVCYQFHRLCKRRKVS